MPIENYIRKVVGESPFPGVLQGFSCARGEIGLLFYGGATPERTVVVDGNGAVKEQPLQTDVCVKLSCGSSLFARPDRLPYEDMRCPCGDPKHWLVRYV